MGRTHLAKYRQNERAELVAIADPNVEEILKGGAAAGNIDTGGDLGDLSALKRHRSAEELLADPDVAMVDICTPTPTHAGLAVKALQAGKHVMCEKPLALTVEEARRVAGAAAEAAGLFMVAHCIRFWPEYVWAKRTLDSKTYGGVLAASFRRLSATPTWGWEGWLGDEERSGGAALDLHIHDVDAVRWFFGQPRSVTSRASGRGHIVTLYEYPDGPAVSAEGGWLCASGFPFEMAFLIVCERATIEFTSRRSPGLLVYEEGKEGKAPEVAAGDGYGGEIDYFLSCVIEGKRPEHGTAEESAEAVRVALLEVESAKTGGPAAL